MGAAGDRPFVKSHRGWAWFTCVCLLVGALFRFGWIGDVEYKDDEDGMFRHSQAIAETHLWPALGMTSGAEGIRHPALGIWSFGILAHAFGLKTALGLTGAVQTLSLAALALLFWFAWRVVPAAERELWLWTAALASTNLVATVYARKIWIPNLLPVFCVILLIAWSYRRTRSGALAWGVTGALVGQIHLSGFFFGAAVVVGTVLFARRDVRWRAWAAGSAGGAMFVLPWLDHLWANYRPEPTSAAVLQRLFSLDFFRMAFDVSLSRTAALHLGADFHEYLAYPVVGGVATHGVQITLIVSPVIGAIALMAGAVMTVRRVRRFRATPSPSDSVICLFNAALTGVLLSLVDVPFFTHYQLTLFPVVLLWLPAVILASFPRPRLWLLALWFGGAVCTFGFLQFIHQRCGAPHGDFGVAYRCQEPARLGAVLSGVPAVRPLEGRFIRPGQEDLVGRLLARGELLPGPCKLVEGGVDHAVIRASYACDARTIRMQLAHPSRAPKDAVLTTKFALSVDGAAPAGFAEAITEHVRREEEAFRWSLDSYETAGAQPYGDDVPMLRSGEVLLILLGGFVVLLVSSPWWARDRGTHAPAASVGPVFLGLYAIAVLIFFEAASRMLFSLEPLQKRIPLVSEHAWRLDWISRNESRDLRPGTDAAMTYGFDRFDPDVGWSVTPNLRDVPCFGEKRLSTNSDGVRGLTEYADGASRDATKTRVVLLGDSFTFGDEVSDDETYAHFLAGLLPNSEVINLGVHGFGHDQMLLYFDAKGKAYRPDVVIVGFMSLDGERNLLSFRDYAKPRYLLTARDLRLTNHPVPPPDEILRSERYRSKLWDALAIAYTTFEGRYTDWREKRMRRITRALLSELRTSIRRAGAVPVFAFLPHGAARFDPEPREDEHEFSAWCRASHVRCITLRPDFVRHAESGGVLTPDGRHWGPDEHRVAARGLAQYLRTSRLAGFRNRHLGG